MKIRNMDIVYIVRPGDDNEELRHSLRSVAENLPHARIVIAGYKPHWVKNVYHIATDQTASKYENAANNWAAAMADRTITGEFIAMNDDFYIMQELQELPVLHRGRNNAVIGYYDKNPGNYIANMRRTRDLLVALGVPAEAQFSYALHVPMVMRKEWRQIATAAAAAYGHDEHKVQMRTLYGNFWGVGGSELKDVKSSNRDGVIAKNDTFLSSNDQAFNEGAIGNLIRERFNNKCKYER